MYQLQCDENGQITGNISFKKSAIFTRLKSGPAIVSILPPGADCRIETETFIKTVYARSYGASIKVHYPILMSIRDDNGSPLAAAGFRPAAGGSLFLEQYLKEPVENLLGLPREKIVEIGNLASVGGENTLILFLALSGYLYHKGFLQAVITGTGFLEKRLRRMGLEPKCLASAEPAHLIEKDEDWGTYYEKQPRVYSGSVENGYIRLHNLYGANFRGRKSPPSNPFPCITGAYGP